MGRVKIHYWWIKCSYKYFSECVKTQLLSSLSHHMSCVVCRESGWATTCCVSRDAEWATMSHVQAEWTSHQVPYSMAAGGLQSVLYNRRVGRSPSVVFNASTLGYYTCVKGYIGLFNTASMATLVVCSSVPPHRSSGTTQIRPPRLEHPIRVQSG